VNRLSQLSCRGVLAGLVEELLCGGWGWRLIVGVVVVVKVVDFDRATLAGVERRCLVDLGVNEARVLALGLVLLNGCLVSLIRSV
jgi:ABC-type enterochelin transport system permease subunit